MKKSPWNVEAVEATEKVICLPDQTSKRKRKKADAANKERRANIDRLAGRLANLMEGQTLEDSLFILARGIEFCLIDAIDEIPLRERVLKAVFENIDLTRERVED